MGFNLGFKGLMKHEPSQQIFKKYSNIKFHENPPSRSGVAPCRQTDKTDGWTDRHEEANSCFLQFCEHA